MDRPSSPSDTTIDWEEARRFISAAVRFQIGNSDGADADDLTQEALVRLLRTLRREQIRNLEALMNDIARKTVIDWQRTRSRWRAMIREFGSESPSPQTTISEPLGDPIARTRFVVLTFFQRYSPDCHKLAMGYFAEACRWPEVAREMGLNSETVRRRWSRCVARLRKEVRGDRDFIWRWAQEMEGPADE